MRHINNLLGIIFLFVFLSGCEKFLDVKSDSSRAVPQSIRDFQLMLDHNTTMNRASSYANEVLSDNYYLDPADLNSITNANDRSMYSWETDDQSESHWSSAYTAILHANVVMEGIDNIVPTANEREVWKAVKGGAHFFRAFYFEGLLQLFSMPYNPANAGSTPGIPLRLGSDFNEKSIRSSVEECYQQIIKDLMIAAENLPSSVPFKGRPSKAAAFGMLARAYLTMHKYDSVLVYSEKCLSIYDSLLNYNSLNPAANAPFPAQNREIIFFARSLVPSILLPVRARMDSSLIRSYQPNDLRFSLYFRPNSDGTFRFKGDYDGSGLNAGFSYTGIVTDEQYLMAAEAAARLGDGDRAVFWLNKLLITRFSTGTFQAFNGDNPEGLIDTILIERRKSLLLRGSRWRDLRRLSIDPIRAIRPKRVVDGIEKTLVPGSIGYRMPIPALVKANSTIIDHP